jgi:hypothetical protein
MLAFLLITAHLSLPANDQRLRIDVPAPKSVADIRPQASRYFLNIGEAQIEVDIKLENSALRTEDVLEWVHKATEAVATYYGGFPVRRARVSVIQNNDDDRSIHGTTWGSGQVPRRLKDAPRSSSVAG